jgi:chemotaxis protein methyltransferase CheR
MIKFKSDILGLPKGTDTLLRDLVHEYTGMFFDSTKMELLTDKLSPLVVKRGFNSFLDYYYFLKYDAHSRLEWENVINAVSVGETYFWREIDQIRALTQTIVPHWFATHPGRTLRIWSSACASGEEPLTIAMVLDEGGWFQRGSIEIHASDASSDAIAKARNGIYRERSFRSLSAERRLKYFTEETSASWRVQSALQSRVQYSLANLMNPNEIAGLASADVIFCRNVFIYFSETAIARVVRNFSKFMPTPGHLFVGSSESLIRIAADFALQEVDNAFVYIKEPYESSR